MSVYEKLDKDGFVVLPDVLSAEQIDAMLAKLEELMEQARRDPTVRVGGTLHLNDLVNSCDVFDPAWSSPAILDAVRHVIGEKFRILTVGYRAPKPGHGAQSLHADAPERFGDYLVATTIVALVDFTESNGATRLVPGSHVTPKMALPKDSKTSFPGEVRIAMKAGCALVFNGHIRHSGTQNESGQTRHALQITFARRGALGFTQAVALSEAAIRRLGDRASLFS